MSKFAAVMVTSSKDLLQQATSVINSMPAYDNDVEVHLIAHPSIEREHPGYLENLPKDICKVVNWSQVQDPDRSKKSESGDKNSGWECRFYRYRYCLQIADQYDAIMITDADMFFCNNIMSFFEDAASDGLLHMPNNPWGSTDARVDKTGIDAIHGASSPPYHNMPLFFSPSKHIDLINNVYQWGLKEPFGDMATLYRTLFRMGMRDKIVPTDNDLWVVTDWYKYMMSLDYSDNGRPVIRTKDNLRVNAVHRRWNMQSVRDKYIGDIKEDDNRERGVNNVKIFWEVIQWLLAQGPAKYE